MAVTETSSSSPDQPLPRRKSLIVPELEIFGAGYSDERYREEIEMYLGQKVVISSTQIRHFRANGLTIKFLNDPLSIEKEVAPLLEITTMPTSRTGEPGLILPWNHPELGIVEPFVPLDRTVTTIFLPIGGNNTVTS